MSPALREVLLLSLFNIGAVCFFVGLFLAIAPHRFLAVTERFNRWVSTDETFAALDRPRPVDRLLYRRHVWTGLVVLAGSLYMLYVFWFRFDLARVLRVLPVIYNGVASAWVYESLLYMLRGAAVTGLLAGIVILARPSLLKSIEQWGNRWVATDRFTRRLDARKDLPASWFPGRARGFGIAIVAGSFYVMWQCGSVLWGR